MKETWPPVRSTTLTDQVYSVLRDRVLAGKMVPGEFIREQEVSERLEVSRTPVREALGRLASEGFIERIPHRGFRVPEESFSGMIEFYPIISALELLAAEEGFPRLDADALAELRAVNEEYRLAFESQDVAAGISINNRFHHLLSAASSNGRLTRMLDELRSKVESLEIWAFSHIDEWDDSIAEHEAILAAIEAGDYAGAAEVLETNRLTTYRDYQAERWRGAGLTPAAVAREAGGAEPSEETPH